MSKLCKILSVIAVVAIVIFASISVRAYTNNDVIDYITGEHEVNGRTLQLNQKNAARLKLYFEENPVTDDQANEIIAKLEDARNKLTAAGVSTASEVKAYDAINHATLELDVVTLIQEAGAIAGLDIEVDTVNEIVTIKDKDGNNIINPTDYLDLFGSNTPDAPNKPVDPDKPNKPEDPSKPVNPNKPNNSNNNNNNSNNNNSNSNNSNSNNNNASTTTTSTNNNTKGTKKLVYTGNDYSFVIKTIVAIVAVAIMGIVIKKYAK